MLNGKKNFIKALIQKTIRYSHIQLSQQFLPHNIALYFHTLETNQQNRFKELVNFFKDQGYQFFASPNLFLTTTEVTKKIFISFDDNYRAWFESLTLFDQLNLKATFYVNSYPFRDECTDQEVKSFFNSIHFFGQQESLSQAELLQIAQAGHNIGSHTHTHPLLTKLPLNQACQEIYHAKKTLEKLIHKPVLDFAYPYGLRRHFNRSLQKYCIEIGIQSIANAIPGLLHLKSDRFNINRTYWDLHQPLDYNLANLKINSYWFEKITGRSAVG